MKKKKLESVASLQQAEDSLKKHPLVTAALEVFGGRLELGKDI